MRNNCHNSSTVSSFSVDIMLRSSQTYIEKTEMGTSHLKFISVARNGAARVTVTVRCFENDGISTFDQSRVLCFPFQQVESEDNFERIGGSSIGGGTFWGLGALLTKTKVDEINCSL